MLKRRVPGIDDTDISRWGIGGGGGEVDHKSILKYHRIACSTTLHKKRHEEGHALITASTASVRN